MASSRGYLDYIMEQLSGLDGVTWRPMMGEYIIYYGGRAIGGIYDDRFLVKPCPSALRLMPGARRELPYEGGREMMLVDELDDRDFLRELVVSVSEEVPEQKKRKKKAE